MRFWFRMQRVIIFVRKYSTGRSALLALFYI